MASGAFPSSLSGCSPSLLPGGQTIPISHLEAQFVKDLSEQLACRLREDRYNEHVFQRLDVGVVLRATTPSMSYQKRGTMVAR
jgi:hypothetical protein